MPKKSSSSPSSATHGIPPVQVGTHGKTVLIGGDLPVLIAGPCVIESEAHALHMAALVKAAAAKVKLPVIFKASYDKANRTSHASFRGNGMADGLRILRLVRERTGLPVTTDVHAADQVAAVAESVDLIQVPALLCRQTDLVEACARSGKPISIKKGQFLAPHDCGNIVAKFRAVPRPSGAPEHRLVLIERGSSFGYNTLVTDFRALPVMRGFGVPVIFDGTHSVQAPGGMGTKSGGAGHFAPMMMRAAMAVGVEGLFFETHDHPAKALSDGPNVVPTNELDSFLRDVRGLHRLLGRRDPPVPRG
jgi:2-dehydro-3-deoxyphosphooctonate aldolase (KDO 8-P synthase)